MKTSKEPTFEENIEKWCEELRSKKFKQGKQALQNKNGYCCLGVACKVFIPEGKLKIYPYNGYLEGENTDGQPYAPEWLKNINDSFRNICGNRLSALNDYGACLGIQSLYITTEPFTFDEIADLLEAVFILKVLD